MRAISDDEILDWWEAHAAGDSVEAIAARFGRQARCVRRHFEELGIPLHWDDLDAREQRIAEALGRCGPTDSPGREPGVAFARSMQHIKPVGKRVPQSKRERRLDALAGPWRRIVREDLRHAGLLPR